MYGFESEHSVRIALLTDESSRVETSRFSMDLNAVLLHFHCIREIINLDFSFESFKIEQLHRDCCITIAFICLYRLRILLHILTSFVYNLNSSKRMGLLSCHGKKKPSLLVDIVLEKNGV